MQSARGDGWESSWGQIPGPVSGAPLLTISLGREEYPML